MMLPLLGQLQTVQPSFWNGPNGDPMLVTKIIVTFIIAIVVIIGLMRAPSRFRRPIVCFFTFIAGAFWVLFYFWPTAQARTANDAPVTFVERVSFGLQDAVPVVSDIANILSAFLLGLGVYSLLRIHFGRFIKRQRYWPFSLVLLFSMLAMMIFGFGNWISIQQSADPAAFGSMQNWGIWQFGRDLLFDGLLQQMDAAMFSLIAFYILSAAYRAFRIRSIEATVLLATALIVMLSLMAYVEDWSNTLVNLMTGNNEGSILNNLKLANISEWIRQTMQTPGIRALDFGIGIGALAMGLRLWLGIERGGVTT